MKDMLRWRERNGAKHKETAAARANWLPSLAVVRQTRKIDPKERSKNVHNTQSPQRFNFILHHHLQKKLLLFLLMLRHQVNNLWRQQKGSKQQTDAQPPIPFVPPLPFLVIFALGFAAGVCTHWVWAYAPTVPESREDVLPPFNQYSRAPVDPKVAQDLQGTLQGGIYPLLRDFQCGHDNLETPRSIAKGSEGRGRFVVDVGLGEDGQETLDAVTNGFTVFAFEMMTGSMAGIKEEAKNRGLLNKLHFVEFHKGADDNKAAVPKKLPKPPDGSGYAYIFNAGLSDESGGMYINDGISPTAKVVEQQLATEWEPGMVPFITLDSALPDWVDSIFFVKIDTQGWEAKVLRGMQKTIDLEMIQYLQFEFSPWLMADQNSGDPYVLLQLLPNKGAVCFDMMGEHNKINRPSKDFKAYFDTLNNGLNGNKYRGAFPRAKYKEDKVGPWEDILCWFPAATN